MRHFALFALLTAVAALAACGGTTSDSVPSDASIAMDKSATLPALPRLHDDRVQQGDGNAVVPVQANTIAGTVAGTALNPLYSFFLQGIMRVGDDQPTLVLVVTDTANLCAHIGRGTMVKNSVLFAVAMVQTDGAPVHPGYAYTAPGHHGRDNLPRSMAFFRQHDGRCEMSPGEAGAQAEFGQAMLRELTDHERVVADFAFDFGDGDQLSGHIDAPFCDAPYFFENPEQFYMPVEPDSCLYH